MLVHAADCRNYNNGEECKCWFKWLAQAPPFSLDDDEEVEDVVGAAIVPTVAARAA